VKFCRSCGGALVDGSDKLAGEHPRCGSQPVEGKRGDPENGGSPPPGELPVDQRADTVPAPPPTETHELADETQELCP